jgi:pimeloyl-ACP methyl ester carboxylesterase
MPNRLYYHRQGAGSARIVFLHGNTGSSRWWRPTMDALPKGYSMIAVDLRGYGRSPDGSGAVTLAEHAREVHELVASLDFGDFVLVGHSLGGGVAMQFAADYPEVLRGLVLVDPAPVDGLKGVDYGFLELALKNNWLVAGLRATMVRPPIDAYFAELAEDCLRSAAAVIPNTRALEAADFTDSAPLFTKPVLVIHGERDAVVAPAESEKTAKAFPAARLAVIAGVGHSPQVEDPAEFAGQLRMFMESLR